MHSGKGRSLTTPSHNVKTTLSFLQKIKTPKLHQRKKEIS
jgi:hypothetical protein